MNSKGQIYETGQISVNEHTLSPKFLHVKK